ncbi:uncharacterized protein MELLADRAFT_55849 [Melampsora larici-populina 98AG31]|uniref:Uncharacterized protein n=1 Tax=Melampsora larici-populina (strain 98AG31 / pathotype 3-4-7) TaxID=747676 RepID=F4RJ62_MELLP|nr:uncharacterized protein MELLADRAFT_55849 [Melampsora larici-populina 98AG31]EGG07677.1 hypothetical protein MELLADRAFT_55849 [Melampsora larici-populina 98AG31]
MSEIVKDRITNFVIHLAPDVNPYQATADYVANFLLPCTLPSWSRYVEFVILAGFLIMFSQASYILYVRSKTKKIYHIGLNDMGLIQYDRANHCGLFYFLYSILGMTQIVVQPFVRNGHLDQGGPDFLLGIQFTLKSGCSGVVSWLAICHCLSVQGYVFRRSTPVGQFLSAPVTWAMNVSSVMIFLGPTVTCIISYYQVAMEYHRIRQLVMPVVDILRDEASTCAIETCTVIHMIPRLLSLITRVSHHIDLLVHWCRIGTGSYLFFDGCIIVIYIPLLYRLFRSFKAQRRLFRGSQRQQDRIFANTLIEFAIILITFVLCFFSMTLIQEGDFIFNPSYFLVLRIGVHGVLATLGNIALFLIICSYRETDIEPPKVHIPNLPSFQAAGFSKSDQNVSPSCYPYL